MKNYLTFKQIDSECLHLARLSQNELDPGVRQTVINNIMAKQYGLLDGLNDPFWDKTITLTVAGDQERLKDFATNGGVLTALDAAAHTITRNDTVFIAGSILDIVMVLKANGTPISQYKARVTVGGAVGTYAVIDAVTGAETTFAGATHCLYVNVMKKLSATSASIADEYVKSIKAIYDDQAAGNKTRLFDLYTDTRAYMEAWNDPYKIKRIVCLHKGDTIEFTLGPSATALGTVQADVKGKPGIYTDATENNIISQPQEENAMLSDEIVAEYCRQANKEIPASVTANLALYQKQYESAAAARAKSLEERGQRSS